MRNVKGVIWVDKPTENYHPISALQSFLMSFSSMFWFLLPTTLLFWFSLIDLINLVFLACI